MPLFSAGSVVDMSAALDADARAARAASVLARRLAALEAADHAAAACSAAPTAAFPQQACSTRLSMIAAYNHASYIASRRPAAATEVGSMAPTEAHAVAPTSATEVGSMAPTEAHAVASTETAEALSEVVVVGLDDGVATAAAALEAEERRLNAASVIEVHYGSSITPL